MQKLNIDFTEMNIEEKMIVANFTSEGRLFAKITFDLKNDLTTYEGNIMAEIPFDTEEQHKMFVKSVKENAEMIIENASKTP